MLQQAICLMVRINIDKGEGEGEGGASPTACMGGAAEPWELILCFLTAIHRVSLCLRICRGEFKLHSLYNIN